MQGIGKASGARGQRRQGTATSTPPKRVRKTPTRNEDGFDPPASTRSTTGASRRQGGAVQVTSGFLESGRATLEKHRREPTGSSVLTEAGRILGGLTAMVVVNVLHQFQAKPNAKVDSGIESLGELTGALFVEYLGAHVQPEVFTLIDGVVSAGAAFTERFDDAFGMSPLEATQRFLGFITATDGRPERRLAGTVYSR